MSDGRSGMKDATPFLDMKVREKSRLRSAKIDVKDCRSIAEPYFLRDCRIHGKLDERDEKAVNALFPSCSIL
jgi:hypothetical protein